MLWDTRRYAFWLIAVSLFCWALERIRPWRRGQRMLRAQIAQDLFFLAFNGHYFGLLLAHLLGYLYALAGTGEFRPPSGWGLLREAPFAVQFAVFFLLKDFLEWCVHFMLHRVGWLWQFHKLHHTIQELDWVGNFRFHWIETVIYKAVTYLPLLLLGVRPEVLLPIAVVSTLIGDLNHANLNLTWGPLRYLLNSPRMHVWHHDFELHGRYGQNFAIVFSLWDWLFGTAYMPPDRAQPERLGFPGMERYPRTLLRRLLFLGGRRYR